MRGGRSGKGEETTEFEGWEGEGGWSEGEEAKDGEEGLRRRQPRRQGVLVTDPRDARLDPVEKGGPRSPVPHQGEEQLARQRI